MAPPVDQPNTRDIGNAGGRTVERAHPEAADFVLVKAYPEGATSPAAAIILMLPHEAVGRRVDPN